MYSTVCILYCKPRAARRKLIVHTIFYVFYIIHYKTRAARRKRFYVLHIMYYVSNVCVDKIRISPARKVCANKIRISAAREVYVDKMGPGGTPELSPEQSPEQSLFFPGHFAGPADSLALPHRHIRTVDHYILSLSAFGKNVFYIGTFSALRAPFS